MLKIYDLAGKFSVFSSKNRLTEFINRDFNFENDNPSPIISWSYSTFLKVAQSLTKLNDDKINELIREQREQ